MPIILRFVFHMKISHFSHFYISKSCFVPHHQLMLDAKWNISIILRCWKFICQKWPALGICSFFRGTFLPVSVLMGTSLCNFPCLRFFSLKCLEILVSLPFLEKQKRNHSDLSRFEVVCCYTICLHSIM